MDRMQAREEALRRSRRKKMGRSIPGEMTAGPRPQRRMTIGQKQRLKERLRRQQAMQAAGMLTGGQAKIAAKAPPPNKITGADFAVLRKEKAKGRGKGLQDEKMKPGKIIKAKKSKFIERRKELMGMDTILRRDPTTPIKNVGVEDRYGMPIKAGKELGSRAMKAAKATRMGKIAAGVAAAALAAKAGLEKMYEKKTGKKPFTKRPEKKMGGGMMMRPNPVGYKTGKMIKARGCKLGKNKPTKMY